jgi:hypothetical protein
MVMTKKRFDISQPVQLQIARCGGPLTMRGWDRSAIEIEAEGPSEELEARLEGTALTVEARRSCSIRCPRDTTVKVGRVDGHLSISSLDQAMSVDTCRGPALLRDIHAAVSLNHIEGGLRAYSIDGTLHVERIGGSASIKAIQGTATLESVGGTLRAQRLGSDLAVQRVGGDLRARSIAGFLEVEQVGGSLRAQGVSGRIDLEVVRGSARVRDLGGRLDLKEVGGNLRASILGNGMVVGRVGGNLHLEGPLVAGQSYHGDAKGNITLRLPISTSARLDLGAGGRVRNDLPLTVERRDRNRLVGALGEGAAQVTFTAGGNVRLREWAGADVEATEWVEELEGLAEQVERQVDDALRDVDLEAVGREIETRMAQAQQKLDSVDWERLGREAQQAANAGIAQAQEAIQRVLSRMETWRDRQTAVQTEVREVEEETPAEELLSRSTPEPHPDPIPAQASEATDEERMAILRMVERGQITPDEGEMLLDTLEE